jgi:hypothetical protein
MEAHKVPPLSELEACLKASFEDAAALEAFSNPSKGSILASEARGYIHSTVRSMDSNTTQDKLASQSNSKRQQVFLYLSFQFIRNYRAC